MEFAGLYPARSALAFAATCMLLWAGTAPLWADTPDAGETPIADKIPSPANAETDPTDTPPTPAYDASKYMAPNELKRGMKGYGLTVVEDTRIDTFEFEILSVMENIYEARQAMILVRCSGLNLEKTGIAAGMSGSPCYIRDTQGRDRLIGAVAFGWSLNKEPICGLQPITQMLDIPQFRDPSRRPKPQPAPGSGVVPSTEPKGVSLDTMLARVWHKPLAKGTRFSLFGSQITPARPREQSQPQGFSQIRPLTVPVMVSGASPKALSLMQEGFEDLGLKLISSGSAGGSTLAGTADVKLEPGSTLCVPLMTGDIRMDALGTCTEVIGNKVLGFGHSFLRKGFVELPMATGMVHTVLPSMMESWKFGSSLKTVGTLWGDEQTGIFGICGPAPASAPLTVHVRDLRGERTYHYQMVRDRMLIPETLSTGVGASLLSHNDLPPEHVLKYDIRIDFENVGTYKTTNFTSQMDTMSLAADLLFPTLLMVNTPFEETKVTRAEVNMTVEEGARVAQIDRVQIPRTTYKPGETIEARIRWRHERRDPIYTTSEYKFTLPAELEDGICRLTLGSAASCQEALRQEKPHLFRAQNLAQTLEAINLAASFPENRLYVRLTLPDGGLAIGRTELPELPSYRQKIIMDSRRADVQAYSESTLIQYETDFVVSGAWAFEIRIQRKEDY